MGSQNSEWLELAEAAEMLGVHFTTLRRWADQGKIAFVRTPTGRRRFRRTVIQGMAKGSSTPSEEKTIAPSEMQTLDFARHTAQDLAHQPGSWMETMSPEQRLAFRYSGQRLLALLMQITAREDPEPVLSEAHRLAKDYGELCFRSGMMATDLVQAFLFFRRSILDSIHATTPGGNVNDPEGQRLFKRANDFFDMFLLITLDQYIKLDYQRLGANASSPHAP